MFRNGMTYLLAYQYAYHINWEKNHLNKKLNKAADCSFTKNVKISSSETISLGSKLEPELMIGQIEMNISTKQISHSGLLFFQF